jgi:type IV pilus assembly protein PilW
MRGLSLVEVMVTVAIGLVITLGVVGVVGVNQQNLRITEGLSESQENARMAFELIARDVRQARDTGCGPVTASRVTDLNTTWWGNWYPIQGFGGTTGAPGVTTGGATGQRVSGTEALQLQGTGEAVVIGSFTGLNKVTLKTSSHSLKAGTVVICDMDNASLHNVTAVSGADITISPNIVISDPDNPQFQAAQYVATTWYIGNNGRAAEGGRSLYRVRRTPAGTTLTEEILPGVVGMNIRYHRVGQANFVATPPANEADSDLINAIELELVTETTQSSVATEAANADAELVGSDGRLRRSVTHVIAIRNTL